MPEKWKDVIGYEGLYQVSSKGRVRSVDRLVSSAGRFRKEKGRVKALSANHDGYPRVGLYKGGKGKYFSVHRLVAAAFIPNPENKPLVDHINGTRNDNRVKNLRWATHSQNNAHCHSTSRNSGIVGVRRRDACKKNPWEVSGSVGGKEITIGYFPTLPLAIQARKKHLKEVFSD